MPTLIDVHEQFALFFKSRIVQPFAYLLSKKLSEGHICLALNEINELQNQLPSPVNYPLEVDKLKLESIVSTNISDRQPFVIWKNKLYLHKYFYYETQIINKIQSLIANENPSAFKQNILNIKTEIENTFNIHNNENVNWQFVACIMALTQNFSIITGGPGTGKTTTVSKILSLLYLQNPKIKVALTAPTGKAASRMAESIKFTTIHFENNAKNWLQDVEPQTIHRLLKKNSSLNQKNNNQTEWLTYDVIIVDESSMIDVSLFAQLLQAIKSNCKIIFLGDQNQLSSVEAGSLFGDLCLANPQINYLSNYKLQCLKEIWPDQTFADIPKIENKSILFEHITRLTFSHRFKDEEGIGKLSKAILEANESIINNFYKNNEDEQIKIVTDNRSKIFEEFVLGYANYIHEKEIALALKKLNHYKILCAVREGEFGVNFINKMVEKILVAKKLLTINDEFYENRPIIITQNNYDLGLYNGDIGIVRNDEKGVKKVWFENTKGELQHFHPELLNFHETVFALTIHKSQGSEFNHIYIVLPQQNLNNFLSKELIYTAVTRAKESVKLETNYEALINAIHTSVKRSSGIKERLLELN